MSPLVLLILRYVGGAVFVIGFLGGVYRMGGNAARRDCNAAEVRSQLVAVQADLAIAKRSEADAMQRAQGLTELARKNAEKVDAFERDHLAVSTNNGSTVVAPKAPLHGRCPPVPPRGLSDADARRLRDIH